MKQLKKYYRAHIDKELKVYINFQNILTLFQTIQNHDISCDFCDSCASASPVTQLNILLDSSRSFISYALPSMYVLAYNLQYYNGCRRSDDSRDFCMEWRLPSESSNFFPVSNRLISTTGAIVPHSKAITGIRLILVLPVISSE